MMESLVFPVVDALSALTVTADFIAALLFISLLTELRTGKRPLFARMIHKRALLFMFVVALVATSGSLFFSEIAQWTPCKLCWFQRIFMYPQVVLLGIALWKEDKSVARYILALCLIGIAFSTVHYIEQIHATFFAPSTDPLVPCDATGISCAQTYALRFGYVTIPMMALSAFAVNAIVCVGMMRRK